MPDPARGVRAVEVERRLLASAMLAPPIARHVVAEVSEEEFTHPALRALYGAMAWTVEQGREFDDATLSSRMAERGVAPDRAAQALISVIGAQAQPHAWQEYADLMHEEASWARAQSALSHLADAVDKRDDALREEAARLLLERPGGGWAESMDTLRDEVLDRLEGKRGLHLPTPFGLLNSALGGGMVPGEVTVVGGWTSHAKSVLVMQTADNLVEKGGDAIYLTNEMRRDEVALRVMANHGGPPFPQLRAGQVTVDQWQKVFRAVSKLTLKIIDATMRRVEEVCAFIASRRPDLAVIDLFNRLPRSGGGTQELDDQVSRICDCAARSNTHVMLVSQLNRARLSSSKDYPHPNLGDLRDTGSLATHPANVIFTYLAEEEGIREGYVEVAKARGGRVGDSVPVVLNPVTMRLIQTQLL